MSSRPVVVAGLFRGGGCATSSDKTTPPTCRSELAREVGQDSAGHQVLRVIVDVHREQARSHSL
ncbi:hypothetical protein EMIT0196MI5_380013 [Pseudomonas sp. IT-196MI5]